MALAVLPAAGASASAGRGRSSAARRFSSKPRPASTHCARWHWAPGVQRLALGTLDLAVDLNLTLDEQGEQAELATFRSLMMLASRRAGLAAPVDGVTTALDDEALLLADTLRARRFGFGAKLCIHPRQIAVVHHAFAPSAEQVAWAERVIAAAAVAHGGAARVDGRMVDRPMLLQTEAIRARAACG